MTHRLYNSGVTQLVEPLFTRCLAQFLLACFFVLALAPSVTAQPQPSWNRRVTGLAITTATSGPAGTYDVTAEWRIDLEGSSTAPVELGTAVDLSIAGGPPTTTTTEECLIWELDAGGAFDCTGQPDGTECGTASISGNPVSLTCDADTETCSTPLRTATFPGVPLTPKDFIEVLLRPAPGALPDSSPNDDDDGQLTFGAWNRRAVSLDVTPTAGAPAGIYDATAEVLFELTAGASVPLNLGIDTEPVGDPCCQEACCCPSCSTECSGNGCGGGGGGIEILSMSLSGDIICPGPACNNKMCMTWDSNGSEFTATCDPADCVCRSETITLQWSGLSLTPGAEVYLSLRVAGGALPELQTDDDVVIAIAPCGDCPTDSSGDGNTGAADLAQLLACWGPVVPGCECFDANGNGMIDPFDLATLLATWGPCFPGASNCCIPHQTPGCDDPDCEAAVCAIDPFCCNAVAEWDALCVTEAIALCGDLCEPPPTPENDDCADAIPIFDGDTDFDNTQATTDGPAHPSCKFDGQTYQDLWYDYVATCTGNLTVSTCNQATYDTDMVVYDGCACPVSDANMLDCNDDAVGCGGFTSELIVPVVIDSCYKVRIGGFDVGDIGTGTVTITCEP